MQMKFTVSTLLMTVASMAAAIPPQENASNKLLVGKWTWTRADVGCTEVYDYHSDGTYEAISGAEKTNNTYTISATPSVMGFYKLVVNVVKDFGGLDCALSTGDDTGTSFTNYLLFSPSGNQYWACYSESKDDCFGPLTRVKEEKNSH